MWRRSGASQIHFVLVNDLPTLVCAANLNNIEMHTFLARAKNLEQPSWALFDLDPGPPATILDCARVALLLREALHELDLDCFLKSSGSKGLHLYVPLNTRVNYEQTHEFTRAVAHNLEQQHDDLVVSDMSKNLRAGKVFVDYAQNADYKSTAVVYSLRAKEDGPFVSMPISWQKLSEAIESQDPESLLMRPAEAVALCEKHGDQFREVLQMKQKLPRKASATPAFRRPRKPSTARAKRIGTLEKYQEKRDFAITDEPSGGQKRKPARDGTSKTKSTPASAKQRLFVIQKHAASRLHYDFRLEIQGVLRSWAVPKGPPYQKGERRLAMLVEDHPMDYARFEGTIPKGQYGGGTVMVWDIGTYETFGGNPSQEFYSGKLHLKMSGKKLKGEWTLVRGSKVDERGKEPWYLIKTGAVTQPMSARRDDSSALTGRTMAQIADQNTAQWESNR